MNIMPSTEEEKRIHAYVIRMTELHGQLVMTQQEVGQLRNQAKNNGVDPEALNLLCIARSREPHDSGKSMVTNILSYATIAGTEFNFTKFQADTESQDSAKSNTDDLSPLNLENMDSDTHALIARKIVTELYLSGIIAVGLLWLLN